MRKSIVCLLTVMMIVMMAGCQNKNESVTGSNENIEEVSNIEENQIGNEPIVENAESDKEGVENLPVGEQKEEKNAVDDFDVIYTDTGIKYKGIDFEYNPEDPVHLFNEEELMSKLSMEEIADFMDQYLQTKGCKPAEYTIKKAELTGTYSISINMQDDWPKNFYKFAINSTFLVCYDPYNAEEILMK